MDRRSFMLKGAAAAAMMATPRALRSEETAAGVPTPGPDKTVPEIPPPPGGQVYLERMAATRRLLQAAGASALIEIPGANLRYLTGLDIDWTAPLVIFVLPVEGPPALFAPETYRDWIESGPASIEDLRLWSEDDPPTVMLEKYIKKSDFDDKTLCVGERIWYSEFYRLHTEFPKMRFISTSGIVEIQRERKSLEEIAIIEAAAKIGHRAIERACQGIREGMTEKDLAWVLDSHVREMGGEGDGAVLFGRNTAIPAYPSGGGRLAAGNLVQITSQTRVHGYWARVSRVAVLGKPTGRMKLIHETLRKAQDLAAENVKPDGNCAAVELRARGAIGSAGLLAFFRGRLGNGLGLDREERPYLSRGYHERMALGNVTTVEPGIYTPGDYGIRVGDMLAVTLTGSRWLTALSDGIIEL